jgi:LmbE family N-acetylglucosaminyl deacetylase
MTRVLCIAAHPDDEVLGVGGTLLRHKALGHEVAVYIAQKCGRPDAVSDDEMLEAKGRMGLDYYLGWADGSLMVDEVVELLRPDVVYTHSGADLHEDHRALLDRVLVACRPQSGVRGLYAFETPSATDWSGRDFTPRLFVDITETVEGKEHAMEAYASELRELPHPRNIDSLYHRALYWGQRAGVEYAEAFEVIRECW